MEIKTKEELDNILKENDVVIVRAHAEWCGQCKMLDRTISDIEKDTKINVKFAGIDVEDADEDLIGGLGIRNIPVLIFYKNGEEADRSVGFIMKHDLLDKIANLKQ